MDDFLERRASKPDSKYQAFDLYVWEKSVVNNRSSDRVSVPLRGSYRAVYRTVS